MNALMILSLHTASNIMFIMLSAKCVQHNMKDSQRSHALIMGSERVFNTEFVGMCMMVLLLSLSSGEININFIQRYFVLYFRRKSTR
jgi:hypothetical protein